MREVFEMGGPAPEFSLIGTDGMIHTLNHYRGSRAIVIMFVCNHCPYVLGSEEYLKALAQTYHQRGVVFIGINPNSDKKVPEDSYEKMVTHMEENKFPWVYLHDPAGQIAMRYGASHTPHFFLTRFWSLSHLSREGFRQA